MPFDRVQPTVRQQDADGILTACEVVIQRALRLWCSSVKSQKIRLPSQAWITYVFFVTHPLGSSEVLRDSVCVFSDVLFLLLTPTPF